MSRYMSRAKLTDNGNWVYGSLVAEAYIMSEKQEGSFDIGGWYQGQLHEIDATTIGTCSGEKDTDGMYIYEDDIVEVPYLDPIFGCIVEGCTATGVVVFRKACYCVDYHGDRIVTMHSLKGKLKVVGNIFDNPDLVEV